MFKKNSIPSTPIPYVKAVVAQNLFFIETETF